MNPGMVELDCVSKFYGNFPAVKNVTLSIRAGESVALLGRNGSGKSTLVRLLLGITRPTSGQCRIRGRCVSDPCSRATVGYLPQLSEVPLRLRVGEILSAVEALKGGRAGELRVDFGVTQLLRKEVGALSQGERRLVLLSMALTGGPSLLVLDEPTANLDGIARRRVWEQLDQFKDEGGTVIVVTHDFAEVSAIAGRAVLLANGSVKMDCGIAELVSLSGWTALEVAGQVALPTSRDHFVLYMGGATVVLTKEVGDVLAYMKPKLMGRPVRQRRPSLEEVSLALGGV